MATKRTLKAAKNLVDLLESATAASIQMLATVEEYAFIRPLIDVALALNPVSDDNYLRNSLVAALGTQPNPVIRPADHDATRLLQMLNFRIEELLRQAYGRLEFEGPPDIASFDTNADAVTRLIWLRAKAPNIFDQIEALFLTHHFHGHKNFRSFNVANGVSRDFSWSDQIGSDLQQTIGEALNLSEDAIAQCELIHFEMDEEDTERTQVLHYLIFYHPGSMQRLRQMVNRKRDLYRFVPALEATLVYDPKQNKVHVLSRNKKVAKQLADQFSLIGFETPLSEEPVGTAHYELEMFKSPVDLQAANALATVIEQAWVASLTVSLGYSQHRITFKLNHSDNVWDLMQAHFGSHNPLTTTRAVREVKLSFVVRVDNETTSRTLDITIGESGECSLLTIANPRLRCCGREILTSLGIMADVQPSPIGSDVELLRAELKLLEFSESVVDGHLLNSVGLSVTDLVKNGLITRKAPGQHITVRIEDDEGQQGYRRLVVKANDTGSYAEDELSGERYDLTAGDLTRYAVNRPYLQERLSRLLDAALIDKPLRPDDSPARLEGYYATGEQKIPVMIVSRLHDGKHANKIDTALRSSNLGFSLVLSTTPNPEQYYLGSGIVIPIESLLKETDEGVRVDLSLTVGEIRRRLHLARTTQTPILIKKDDRNALLCGPWPEPWPLNRKDWIDVVEVLVNVWNSGQRKCTKAYLEKEAGDIKIRSLGELFKTAPEWITYIRGATHAANARDWELAIGPATYPATETEGHEAIEHL